MSGIFYTVNPSNIILGSLLVYTNLIVLFSVFLRPSPRKGLHVYEISPHTTSLYPKASHLFRPFPLSLAGHAHVIIFNVSTLVWLGRVETRLFPLQRLFHKLISSFRHGKGHAFRKSTAGAFGPDLAKKLAILVKMEKNVMRSMELVGRERMEVAVRLASQTPVVAGY